MSVAQQIDWPRCPLVEVNPRVQSGAPVLRGTRMPLSAIADSFDYGMSVVEIAEQFEIAKDLMQDILTYAKSHYLAH